MKNQNNEIKSFARLAACYDEEFKLSDFTPEEMQAIIEAEQQNIHTQNKSKTAKSTLGQKSQKTNTKTQNDYKFKSDYFAFYDDVKSHTLKKQDW